MPDILANPPWLLYAVLVLGVIIPLAAVFFFVAPAKDKKSSSRKGYFVTSGIALLLLLALIACRLLAPESDERQITRKMQEMSDGVHQRNLNRVFEHISNDFRVGSVDKTGLRRLADNAQQNHQVDEVIIWDVALEPIKDGKNATVRFMFKVRGSFSNEAFWRGKGYFVRDPDNQWRLQRFEVFNPATDSNTPIQVPGL